uniref:RING-type domain-containing protein n=1 Tax=Amphiprion ocellaris TaxID=80972 RepID=A0A3Q1CRE5_AMPOC
ILTFTPSPSSGPGEPMDVECPICYQEYNQYNKCPRMLECLHVFCTECLQRIQLCPCEPPDTHSPPAIPCPLCRHLTPLEAGDALTLPCSSRILARLPPMAFRLPVTMATRLSTVTQGVVLSLEGNSRDTRFIILPTEEAIQQSKGTLFCVQLLLNIALEVSFIINIHVVCCLSQCLLQCYNA